MDVPSKTNAGQPDVSSQQGTTMAESGRETAATRNRTQKPFFRRRKRSGGFEDAIGRHEKRRMRINRMKKGIFILPSLLTLTSIFLSFYAMVCAINANFVWAGALILFAAFFDGIDGRVARLTKTTTQFGLELDSLADVISFGVAPGLIMYVWVLEPYGSVGWVAAFVFVACAALRLARFNVQSGRVDPKRFIGLPVPAAACMVATTLLFFDKLSLDPEAYGLALLVLTYALSFLMVSAVRFHAFKDLGFVKQKPFSSTVAFVLVLALIAASPCVVLFLLSAGYVISGPVLTIILYRKKKLPEDKPAEDVKEASLPSR
jgi:CDP-diacylglycerol--serine O-phosphatidyltransferase